MAVVVAERAGGKSWATGPHARKGERNLWNDLYRRFSDELTLLATCGNNPAMAADQINTYAWNMAYCAIWTLRDSNWFHGEGL